MITDLISHAQAMIDENRYLTLGTTSADGRPWTSPVCFDEVDAGLPVYPGPNRPGVSPLTRADVTGSSADRLYQAAATDLWVLCPREPRQPSPLHGIARDHRARID